MSDGSQMSASMYKKRYRIESYEFLKYLMVVYFTHEYLYLVLIYCEENKRSRSNP
jgi:hypothetical protein